MGARCGPVSGCRELSTSFDFTGGSSSCTDFYAGLAAGGFAYDVGFGDVDRARLRVSVAVPIDNLGPVDPGTEYYAFRASINRAKSTGVGSCAGCSVPACIVLNEIQLFQVPEAGNDPEITAAAGSNHVLWQSSTTGCAASAGGRTRSWGQLKSLYR